MRLRLLGRTACLLVGAVVLGAVPGCALFERGSGSSAEAFAGRESAQPLVRDVWTRGALDCPAIGCRAWYSVSLAEAGELRVLVRAPVGPTVPDFDVRLEDAAGEILWGFAPTGRSPREIERALGAGDYYLVLETIGDVTGPLDYELRATVAASDPAFPPPPGAPPRATGVSARQRGAEVWVSAEIVEVLGEAGRPVAVVLDAGSADRLRPGERGELVDAGRVIAGFELVEVEANRSRGRLDAAPAHPIRYETHARIRVPLH